MTTNSIDNNDILNTVAEREAELIALQSAFDEYISSSRELEEELDAELAKMQEKLTESTSANMALSAQLENISPQLTSLETALSNSRQKLRDEQKLRRAAEQAQDLADQRVREMEQTLQSLREECDDVHEELAFKENELEETRLELEVEKQQLENELASMRETLHSAKTSTMNQNRSTEECAGIDEQLQEQQQQQSSSSFSSPNMTTETTTALDEAYMKKLEDELELVTEQLIDTEKRLSQAEAELSDKENELQVLQKAAHKQGDDEDLIRILQTEMQDLQEVEQKLRDELATVTEELSLTKEELILQQEELQAAEHDVKETTEKLEHQGLEHHDAITLLENRLREAEVTAQASVTEAAILSDTVKEISKENETINEQVDRLESALANAKKDYQAVLDELDAVNARFDEVRAEGERKGREAAAEELRASMKVDSEYEINSIKESLATLSDENKRLQQKVDEAEMALASARDGQDKEREVKEEKSQVVQQLQAQLARTKEDLVRKDKDMADLTIALEERLIKAEETVTQLESELHTARGQLAEAEAHLIVLRRESKERNISPKPSPRANDLILETPSIEEDDTENVGILSPTSVARLEERLSEEAERYENLEKEYNDIIDQKRIAEVRIKRLEEDTKILQKQLFENNSTTVATQLSRLSSMGSTVNGLDVISDDEVTGKKFEAIIGSRDHKRMAEELQVLNRKINSQREYNAQLLSKMLHLQGNIQVYCRIRPISLAEIQNGCRCVVESLSETEVACFDERTNKWKSFNFDRVWGPDQSQISIFQDVEPLALSVVDGFNACIFAYGQTGSGKTYTMEGIEDKNQFGISYRTIQKIFHLLNMRAQQQRTAQVFVGSDESKEEVSFSFTLSLGMLEIYNDEIYDLLSATGSSVQEKKEGSMRAGGKASLEIRRNQDGRVEVPNLTKETVTSIQEVMAFLKRGNSNRATASTDLNEHSSRSHMVLSVEVISGIGETNTNKGTLYLVDLAGSERVRKSNVEGENLREAGFINKSLSALGNVMEALDRKSTHVPYRDSKLTYLLENALGGNSRTMMVVTTCPIDNSYDETVHALQFATRVRRIQIGAAQRNSITSKNLEETVKKLTDELKALARAKERTEVQLHSLKRDNGRVQEKLQNLSQSREKSRADSKTLEVLRKNNDEMAARWQKEKSAREEASEELEKATKELRTTTQQLSRYKSKLQSLEQRLEDKEAALERVNEQLRQERNHLSAAATRSRRDEVLSARVRSPTQRSQQSQVKASITSRLTTSSVSNAIVASTGSHATAVESSTERDTDVSEIRSKVLALLEKYDKDKVGRIDVIMEKFTGKEALLLEKMTQRYEADANAGSSTLKSRNEMAMRRHQERMRRIHEKREQRADNV